MGKLVLSPKDSKMKKPQEILAEFFTAKSYGDVVTHSEIGRIISYSREHNRSKYNQIVQAAKKILLKEHGKLIECVRDYGYRLVEPGDYVQASGVHNRRGLIEIRKGKDILDYAPVNDMTSDERIVYNRFHDQETRLVASMEGAVCQLKILGKKSHPLLDCVHNDNPKGLTNNADPAES